MPLLPLPPLSDGVPIDAGVLPVSSTTDVSNEWAAELTQPTTAPIRDAIIDGQAEALLAYQRASRYAAAQSDPARATGIYQDEIGSYERGVHRQPGEDDTPYRARYLGFQGVVDPNDIIAAANAVLAPYTTISCRYAESSDGWFLNDGGNAWSSHVFDSAGGSLGSPNETPQYPDRLYPIATAAGLTSIPNRRPPGAFVNEDTFGRWFLLRAPDISAVDTTVAALFDATAPTDGSGFFLTDGSGSFGGEFLFDFASTANDIYNALIGAVDVLVGQGVRWSMTVEAGLTA